MVSVPPPHSTRPAGATCPAYLSSSSVPWQNCCCSVLSSPILIVQSVWTLNQQQSRNSIQGCACVHKSGTGVCSTALRAKAKPEAIAVPNSACKRTQWYFAMNISVLSLRRGLKLCQCKFAPSFFRETRGRRATYLVIFQYVVHGKRRSTGDPENYRRNG